VTATLVLQNIFNGIMLGGLYALIAVGYTMVYGILRLINFAHGDIMMMGIYFAFYAVALLSLPVWLAFIVAILGSALLGFLIDRVAYKPLRNAPRISALITAIGMSFFLESFAVVVFGANYKSFLKVFGEHKEILRKYILIGNARLPVLTILVISITALSLLFLFWIVYKTKIGMAMRAISSDIPTTALMGVNVDMVIGFTFALGSALAAISGIMWAMRYPNFFPYTGFMPGLKAFIAAVFGGIGSIPGAVLGGFLLGMIEILIVSMVPQVMEYKDAFAFVILIIVLLVKPSGLMGQKMIEKV